MQNEPENVRVWDIGVRLFHWTLVAAFVITYLSGEDLETIHAWFGYLIIGLLLFRLVWGFVGTTHARFSDFLRGPHEVGVYLRSLFSSSPRYYVGHNPAGGWMVIALLLSLSLTSWSGLEAYAAEGKGPLAQTTINVIDAAWADDDDRENGQSGEGDEFWEDIHEFFANFSVFLIALHVGGVLVSSAVHRENLVRAMLTGRKPTHRD